jgi:CRP/FNR family transcriptional regulator, cyclic AMP receptor protein
MDSAVQYAGRLVFLLGPISQPILSHIQKRAAKVSFGLGGPERCAHMAFEPDSAQLLSRLPTYLTTDLFAGANPVKLAADQVLFLAGDPGDSCYRVELGLLKVTMVSRSGIERILSFIGRGGIVGELAILDGLPRSASVVAVRDTALSRLTRAEFGAFAERHLELYKSLITLLTQRLRETNVAVAAGSFLSLRELADHFGRDVGSDRIVVEHKIGQSDLAAMAGIARENLSRILKDWERRKIVSRLSGYYCLEDKSKLEREVQQL